MIEFYVLLDTLQLTSGLGDGHSSQSLALVPTGALKMTDMKMQDMFQMSEYGIEYME